MPNLALKGCLNVGRNLNLEYLINTAPCFYPMWLSSGSQFWLSEPSSKFRRPLNNNPFCVATVLLVIRTSFIHSSKRTTGWVFSDPMATMNGNWICRESRSWPLFQTLAVFFLLHPKSPGRHISTSCFYELFLFCFVFYDSVDVILCRVLSFLFSLFHLA